MRTASPTGLVRVNLEVLKRQESRFDFLRIETEASSDSEVTRQALRYFEQLVQDALLDVKLKAVVGNETFWLTVGQFRDNPERTLDLEPRSMILHERSMERLNGIRLAMNADNISEVVRAALRHYAKLVDLSIKGARFHTELPSGETFLVRLPLRTDQSSVPIENRPTT